MDYEDYDSWLFFDGVHHPPDEIVRSVCGVCGCWAPWKLEPYLRKLLLAPVSEHGVLETDAPNWDDATYFAAALLDAAELIEHGSSIAGSWLTERGKELRGLVNGLA